MSRIGIYYIACCLETQTVAPTSSGLQVIKHWIKYLASHSHKPIFYPSNSYDGSSLIRLFQSKMKTQYTRYLKISITQTMKISIKSQLNDIRAAITWYKVKPIPKYLRPSPPPHVMPLSPRHKKPRSGSPNRCGKINFTSGDPNHDGSGSNATITDGRNRSGPNLVIKEYTTKDAPPVVPPRTQSR